MVSVENIVDITIEQKAKMEKGRKVRELAKDFFKYPFIVNPFLNTISIQRWLPAFGKRVIFISPDSDKIICYDKKYFPNFFRFASVYQREIGGLPKLETDYSGLS